jgi:hypothetical protein
MPPASNYAESDSEQLELDIPSSSALAAVAAIAVVALAIAVAGLTHAADNEGWVSVQLWGGVALSLLTAVQLVVALGRRRAGLFAAQRQLLRLEDRVARQRLHPETQAGAFRDNLRAATYLAKALEKAGAYDLALRADRLVLQLEHTPDDEDRP